MSQEIKQSLLEIIKRSPNELTLHGFLFNLILKNEMGKGFSLEKEFENIPEESKTNIFQNGTYKTKEELLNFLKAQINKGDYTKTTPKDQIEINFGDNLTNPIIDDKKFSYFSGNFNLLGERFQEEEEEEEYISILNKLSVKDVKEVNDKLITFAYLSDDSVETNLPVGVVEDVFNMPDDLDLFSLDVPLYQENSQLVKFKTTNINLKKLTIFEINKTLFPNDRNHQIEIWSELKQLLVKTNGIEMAKAGGIVSKWIKKYGVKEVKHCFWALKNNPYDVNDIIAYFTSMLEKRKALGSNTNKAVKQKEVKTYDDNVEDLDIML